jgi:hypothetical protein
MNCYFLAGHFAADQDGKITPLEMMIETREPLHYLIYIPVWCALIKSKPCNFQKIPPQIVSPERENAA